MSLGIDVWISASDLLVTGFLAGVVVFDGAVFTTFFVAVEVFVEVFVEVAGAFTVFLAGAAGFLALELSTTVSDFTAGFATAVFGAGFFAAGFFTTGVFFAGTDFLGAFLALFESHFNSSDPSTTHPLFPGWSLVMM